MTPLKNIQNFKVALVFFSDLHRTEGGLFHKTSLPNKPGLFQLVLFWTKSADTKSD